MRYSTGAASGCPCCPSSNPPITVYRDSGRRIPGPGYVISEISGIITGGIATGSWMRSFSRLHLAPPGSTMDHPDPGCTNRTAKGYIRARTHALGTVTTAVDRRGTSARENRASTGAQFSKGATFASRECGWGAGALGTQTGLRGI